jgi:hypothetical protein
MIWLQRRPAVILLLFAAVAALLVALALVGPSVGTVDRGDTATYLLPPDKRVDVRRGLPRCCLG